MQIALIGLPGAGKTTVFNALTGARARTGAYSSAAEANIAVVQVPDPRLGELTQIFKPKKTIHATVEYVDAGGVVKTEARTEGISGKVLNLRDIARKHCRSTVSRRYLISLTGSADFLTRGWSKPF